MAFKTLVQLDADRITQLGGTNKKTGKKNPKVAEGYYLGSRKVPSTKAKSGYAYIHYIQDEQGNLAIWGKTNLDRQITSVTPGTMVRMTFTGMKDTKNGPMYVYEVAVDLENTIEVGDIAQESSYEASAEDTGDVEDSEEVEETEEEVEEEDEQEEEKLPARAASASKRSEVNAILKRRTASR